VPERMDGTAVRIEQWAETDLELLRRSNVPAMTEHLGGPETEEKILARHRKYVAIAGTGTGRMFRVVLLPEGRVAGSVGYWDSVWQGEGVYEAGWAVLPEFQGRGIAVAAVTKAVARARADGNHRHLHAFPSVGNPASNAVCRRAGFSLVAECDFEYPVGHAIRCNDWIRDLTSVM